MMLLSKLSLAGLLAHASFSVALPGALDNRQACNRDNCLRAVIANNAKPGPSAASEDCISFFRKTATPCPSDASTTTTVISTTEVVATPTTTVVVTSTVTDTTLTDVVNVPYTTTVATVDVTSTVSTLTAQDTVTETATVTDIETSITVTTTTTSVYHFSPSPVANRRDLNGRSDCTKIATPTVVPTYASACSGVVRYSSACSCIGITQATLTATLPVVTSSVTSTIYSTPPVVTETSTSYVHVTASTTVTSSIRYDATATNDVLVTATITIAPATFTSTSTSKTTTTVTSTSYVPGPTQYCKMNLRAVGGAVDGRRIYIETNRINGHNVIGPAGSTRKNLYRLDTEGKLIPLDEGYTDRMIYLSGASPYMYSGNLDYQSKVQGKPILCKVDSSTLEMTCKGQTVTTRAWVFSDGYVSNGGNYLWLSTSIQGGSTQCKLYAEPVDCKT